MYIVIFGVLFLLGLMLWLRLNAFIALLMTAVFCGILAGLSPADTLKSVQNGIGSTLGSLVMVLGLGVMLGKVLSESGATQQMTDTLLRLFGIGRAKYVLVVTGFVVGVAMFYNAGFMVLLPLVFSMSERTGMPLVYLALPMASALSVTHGFLPPHPSPTALAGMFHADIRLVLWYGFMVAIPAIIAAGVFFPEYFKKSRFSGGSSLFETARDTSFVLPGFLPSVLIAIMPIILMGISSLAELTLIERHPLRIAAAFCGDPGIALLLTLLSALYFLAYRRKMDMALMRQQIESVVGSVAMILLIIAAGGAFKQVLVDSGIGAEVSGYAKLAPVSPLVLGWLVAALVRVSLGSATVAGLMAGGIMTPMMANNSASPELMVLSIGAGSLMFSHVNDTGFWMFKSYFGLSIRETILSWSLMESIVSVVGLLGVLLLDIIV